MATALSVLEGEQSARFQKVDQILIDCDQDRLLLKVTVTAGQCHAGYQYCFYRADRRLESPYNANHQQRLKQHQSLTDFGDCTYAKIRM
jgi:hypothetical protein